MKEIWKPIPGYGNCFEASSLGRIKRNRRTVFKISAKGKPVKQVYQELILSPSNSSPLGYLAVHIGANNKKYTLSVHRAVLLAFVGPCPEGMEACHNDGNASNNVPHNLRWDTHLSNNQDRKKHGRYAVGEDHHRATMTIEQVRKIRAAASTKDIAKELGIPYKKVWRVRKGETWSAAK